MKPYFNLPQKVVFCSKCVISNQRPSSINEATHTKNRDNSKYINFDKSNVCDACRFAEKKKEINWDERESKLKKLLMQHKKNDGSYDCIVPGSGGKDSVYATYILKEKYGMHPLTVTWPPILYTDYGNRNFNNWIEYAGIDNLTFKRNPKIMKLLTRLSIENLLHPFQTFIFGQKNLAPKIANSLNIKLIFYGEPEAEYGNDIKETKSSIRNTNYFSYSDLSKIYLAGEKVDDLIKKYNITLSDLSPYLPLKNKEKSSIPEVHYLGYYHSWTPQEAYYKSVEYTKFKPRPFRSQGTYSKYNSIDDKIDDLHYYTTFIKFGIGRATYDASQEIRNNHITREEGKLLVKQFDGEFPDKYFDEIMDYIDIDKKKFHKLCDEFRSPHLWKKTSNGWKLKHTVNNDGVDD
jgi:N-acetyl sugar amidotransferase